MNQLLLNNILEFCLEPKSAKEMQDKFNINKGRVPYLVGILMDTEYLKSIEFQYSGNKPRCKYKTLKLGFVYVPPQNKSESREKIFNFIPTKLVVIDHDTSEIGVKHHCEDSPHQKVERSREKAYVSGSTLNNF